MSNQPPTKPAQRQLVPADLASLEQQSKAQAAERRRHPVPEGAPDPTLQHAPERAEPVVPQIPTAFKAGAPFAKDSGQHELLAQLASDFGLRSAPTTVIEIASYRWTLRAPNYPDHDWCTEVLVAGRASAASYQLIQVAGHLAAINGVPVTKLFGVETASLEDANYPTAEHRYAAAAAFMAWIQDPRNLTTVELIERVHSALNTYHEKVKGESPLWETLSRPSMTLSTEANAGRSGPPPSPGGGSSPPTSAPATYGTTPEPPGSSSAPVNG
jgi:hypothetical protein